MNEAIKKLIEDDIVFDSWALRKALEIAVEALERLGEVNAVQGDCVLKNNPHSKQMLNMNTSWLTGGTKRSLHQSKQDAVFINQALEEIQAIAEGYYD
jgi:hypothetical protein